MNLLSMQLCFQSVVSLLCLAIHYLMIGGASCRLRGTEDVPQADLESHQIVGEACHEDDGAGGVAVVAVIVQVADVLPLEDGPLLAVAAGGHAVGVYHVHAGQVVGLLVDGLHSLRQYLLLGIEEGVGVKHVAPVEVGGAYYEEAAQHEIVESLRGLLRIVHVEALHLLPLGEEIGGPVLHHLALPAGVVAAGALLYAVGAQHFRPDHSGLGCDVQLLQHLAHHVVVGDLDVVVGKQYVVWVKRPAAEFGAQVVAARKSQVLVRRYHKHILLGIGLGLDVGNQRGVEALAERRVALRRGRIVHDNRLVRNSHLHQLVLYKAGCQVIHFVVDNYDGE